MQQRYILGLRGEKLRSAQIWAVILPAYILFGWNNGVAGPLLDLPTWVETFPRIDTVNTTGAEKTNNSRVQGTVVAMYTLGAFFGALSCIWIGDKLGRKKTIQLGAAVNVVGAILQSTSFSLAQLIVGRLVTGFVGILGLTHINHTADIFRVSVLSQPQHRTGKASARRPRIVVPLSYSRAYSSALGSLSRHG